MQFEYSTHVIFCKFCATFEESDDENVQAAWLLYTSDGDSDRFAHYDVLLKGDVVAV